MQKEPIVRVTGFLIEKQAILLEKQVLREQSYWTLPGGKLELGETLEQALVREIHEETGIVVEVGELLYICDRFKTLNHHVVDISFLVSRVDGRLFDQSNSDEGNEYISDIRMAPFDTLAELGFSQAFISLLENGLPHKGSYQGEFHSFYG